MKNKVLLLLMSTISVLSLDAVEIKDIEFSGQYLGGFNAIKQGSKQQGQFDSAINLDLEFKVNSKLKGAVQLQASPGHSSNALSEGVQITDINLAYTYSENWKLVMGSFDTPFGMQTPYLSNNANILSNSLIYNPLLYQAFAGPMGTLNTVGIMSLYDLNSFLLTTAVSNGTNESSRNRGSNFGYTVNLKTPKFKNTELSASFIQSNDQDNKTTEASQDPDFKADFSGWMIDYHTSVQNIAVKGYYSQLNYADIDPITLDKVTSWMVETSISLNKISLAGRVSQWSPDGNKANQVTAPGLTENPIGLAREFFELAVNQDIIRYSTGVSYQIQQNIILKGAVLVDDYSRQSTAVAGILMLSTVF